MKEFFLSINHYRVRGHIWGANHLPTIVCLHGLGNTSLSFIEIAEELKEESQIISIDLPGHGKSDKFGTETEYEMENMTTWLYQVLEEMNVGEFHFLAHSYGADIALHFMKEYGPSVIRTLLLDGGYTTKEHFYRIVDELASKPHWKWPNINSVEKEIHYTTESFHSFEYPSYEAFYIEEAKSYREWNEDKKAASKDYLKEVDGKIKLIVDSEVASSVIKSMAHSPINKIYSQLEDNILLLVATLPEEFTVINDALLEDVKSNSKIEIKRIEDATHMLHWDQPAVVIEGIREFLVKGTFIKS
ncbi:alpha/beta fold hydrolase [Rossellomorea vietnamensis]|uniref:Alpha/beta fold hydrolase n=1 Tax=Rossellomorea vietnamensis TaxID=218284 RepID=A0A6I6UKW0_9BACI|nr:alpha/beta hydrolase [Rossellomorea vietnamensis]QHE62668.1 alpha/beta fold hydrolase [Rossellomorea vietnamensis]